MSKSDVATLLLFFGLTSVKGKIFTQTTLELIQADTLESYGSFMRRMAKLKPDARTAVERKVGELMTSLAKVFPGMG